MTETIINGVHYPHNDEGLKRLKIDYPDVHKQMFPIIVKTKKTNKK